jgi:hypothetical protein
MVVLLIPFFPLSFQSGSQAESAVEDTCFSAVSASRNAYSPGRHQQAPPGRLAPGSATRDVHRDIPAFVSPETFSRSKA